MRLRRTGCVYASGSGSGVVEDQAEGAQPARPDLAEAVAQIHAIRSSRSGHGSICHGQNDRIALLKRYDFGTRLHTRSLFGDHEFAAGEVRAWLRQENNGLQRETQSAAQVLMQEAILADAVVEQHLGRDRLAGPVAGLQILTMRLRIPLLDSHPPIPFVRCVSEMWVEGCAQARDSTGQRILEVVVIAAIPSVLFGDKRCSRMRPVGGKRR